jgi:methylmalonyl-CoA/ethylmalonyl-CoA epimerase
VFAYNVHHVAIAVRDLDEAIALHTGLYGGELLYREVVADQGVEEAMLPMGGTAIQLLAPLDADSPVGRFLDKRGEGLHHVAYAVADITVALEHLSQHGVELIDREPRRGGGGHSIAFVHPRGFSGTLIELVEVAQ